MESAALGGAHRSRSRAGTPGVAVLGVLLALCAPACVDTTRIAEADGPSTPASPSTTPATVATTATTAPPRVVTVELPEGTTEVATVRADRPWVEVRRDPPPGWDRMTPVVRPADAPPPRSAADLDRVALPSSAEPISGRHVSDRGWRFANPTTYRPPQPLTFGVVERRGSWIRVQLPVRPNGTSGWIHGNQVDLTPTALSVTVSLSGRTLVVADGATTLLETPVAVGAPSTPTPLGRFHVTDVVPSVDPAGPYGPVALALDGYSEALDSFPGASAAGSPDDLAPVLAVHGTNRPGTIGRALSNGCPRVANTTMSELAALVPAGTPVDIVA